MLSYKHTEERLQDMLNVQNEVELINNLLSDYNAQNGTDVSTEIIEEDCEECLISFSDSGVGS